MPTQNDGDNMLAPALLVYLLMLTASAVDHSASEATSLIDTQLSYLVDRWCRPFRDLPSSGYISYDSVVANFFINDCAATVNSSQQLVTFWGLDHVWMPTAAYATMAGTSKHVILKEDFIVSTSFLKEHCRNHILARFYYSLWELLGPFITPKLMSLAVFYLQGFIGLVFSPLVLLSVALSALVLREVGRDQEIRIIPLLQAEIVLQAVGFGVFSFFTEFLSWLLTAPFCFLSPYAALNFEAVGYAFSLWAMNPIWLLASFVKSLIMVERIFALYLPVRYHKVVSKKRITRLLIWLVAATLLGVGVASGVFFKHAFGGQTVFNATALQGKSGVGAYVSAFYCVLLVISALFQAMCAVLLAAKVRKKFLQIGSVELLSTAATIEKMRRGRSLTAMVISTTGLNLLSYTAQMVYIVTFECAAGCSALIPAGTRTDVIVLVTGIVVDLNSSACFVIQCVLSHTYRMAARKLFVTPIGNRLHQLWSLFPFSGASHDEVHELDAIHHEP